MIKVVRQNKESVLDKIRDGRLDSVAISSTNLVDDILLSMHKNGILACLGAVIPDLRKANTTIPFELVIALATAAKMKVKTALTDIPFAIQDHRLLGELGYNVVDDDGVDKGFMTEGALRHLFCKYNYQDLFTYYNDAVQKHIMPKLNLEPSIHILDCTKLYVELSNSNYQKSEVGLDSDNKPARGYKLATIRSIIGDTGIITDTRFSDIRPHDLTLSADMLRTSAVLKHGDILINDRGFIDRDILNYLKTNRGVDTYVPLKANMVAYKLAIQLSQEENKWSAHPNKKPKTQNIAFVTNLGEHWRSDKVADDVEFNACVVWDTKADKPENEYRVFITTDLTKSAKQIIRTYELRPEIEEDFRQIKDFWLLEDFRAKNISLIAFHIMSVLFGYLFFQLFTLLPEGEQYSHKCLPIILKNYQCKTLPFLVFYVGDEFGVVSLTEYAKLYASVEESVRTLIDSVISNA